MIRIPFDEEAIWKPEHCIHDMMTQMVAQVFTRLHDVYEGCTSFHEDYPILYDVLPQFQEVYSRLTIVP